MSHAQFSLRFCRKCLYSSLSVSDMVRFAQMAYPDYDLYKSSGYRQGTPIANQDAAARIVTDMLRSGHYLDFVEVLFMVNTKGFMGKRYPLRGLDDVIDDVIQAGFSFDKTEGIFFENQQERITRNWGRLIEGTERQMSVLRLDIAGNSILVKENPKTLINKAYDDMRKIVTKAVIFRLGRLWSWEGDGALAVFMPGNYSRMAILSGMEILNEMFLYNKLRNPLNSEIKIRLSAHSGNMVYSNSESECLKAETVKKAVTLESKAAVPNSFVISESLAVSQDQALLDIFSDTKISEPGKYRIYQIFQEKN